jgi:putative sterol carrier protein
MEVNRGEITRTCDGHEGVPDIVVTTHSEVFCDMFWGDLNPVQKYLRGEITVKGSQEDVMRLDAISYVIWPDP